MVRQKDSKEPDESTAFKQPKGKWLKVSFKVLLQIQMPRRG